MAALTDIFDRTAIHWRERLTLIVDMMREMSRQTDPQAMVRAYSTRVRSIVPADRMLSLSRRDLEQPQFRITRFSGWKEQVNPWKDKERLPLISGGLLGGLLYSDEPHIIDDLRLEPDDPAHEYLHGQRSLAAVPLFDRGVALNMVVLARNSPRAFVHEQFPDYVWMANLFGRATHSLILSQEVRQAYNALDHEMKVVADIQRALLPAELPRIPHMDLAAHYQTSSRAGGDYYDFFPLSNGRWGVLIADASGHGTPAAVIMAITHAIVHAGPSPDGPPADMLRRLNTQMAERYTATLGAFVTAFYGIFDPATMRLTYASAGHHAPRLKRCEDGSMAALDGAGGLPLGIIPDAAYSDATHVLRPGDQIIFYTDGVTEATNAAGEMFGVKRLDEVLGACRPYVDQLFTAVLEALKSFTGDRPADDDRTMVVAKIT